MLLVTDLPSLPKSKKDVKQRVKALIASGEEYQILPECGKGTGAPGIMLELLCGSEGGNKAIADAVGIELKYKANRGSLLTLFHKDVEGGAEAFLPFLQTFGYIDKQGRKALRHTITSASRFRIARENGNVIVRSRGNESLEVYWRESVLVTTACQKLNDVLLVFGAKRSHGDDKYVRFLKALHLTNFRSTDFLNAIGGQYVVVDFDAREKEPGATVLRNHGTKFRMDIQDVTRLWDDVEELR